MGRYWMSRGQTMSCTSYPLTTDPPIRDSVLLVAIQNWTTTQIDLISRRRLRHLWLPGEIICRSPHLEAGLDHSIGMIKLESGI